ncbi:hypothetical protein FRC08_018308 [Ceratobasidium sp. 394]|nr:hypothetical protein FRC08_018308 [Ceratobasidium sp. 394]
MDTDMSFMWRGREKDFFGELGYEGFVEKLRRAYGNSPDDTEMTFVNGQEPSMREDLEETPAPYTDRTLPRPARDTGSNTRTKDQGALRPTRRHSLPGTSAKQPKSGGRRRSTQIPQHNVNPDSPSPTFPLRPLPTRGTANLPARSPNTKRVFDCVELVLSPSHSSQMSSTNI